MYQEAELTALRREIRRRWLLVLLPVAILAAGLVAAVIRRNEVAADVLTILAGAGLIFCWGFFLSPLRSYEKHLNQMLHGRLHQAEGDWTGMEEDVSMVGGVAFHAVTLTCLDEKGKPYDRLFYYDAEKERPGILRGQRVRITYSDRQIAAVEVL